MNKRTQFILVVICFTAALTGSSAKADTIENFVIISSGASLSKTGGVFSNGGQYWGSFSLDVTQVSAQNALRIPLTSFDVFTTGTYNVEFSSNLGDSGTFTDAPLSSFPTGNEEEVGVTFDKQNVQVQLGLDLIEPAQTFHGGLVLAAFENSGLQMPASDTSGSAYIIDPAVLPTTSVPEPRSGLLLLAGVALLALIGYCRLRSIAS